MAATRTERVVSIKRAIKDVVILGLRDVFTNSYQESAFQNMRVVHEYPKDAQEYPCVVVRFKGRRYPNAGVGHYEIFPDPHGVYRRWEHRRYEGTLEFECCSLSALERDKLSDALLEALSFGGLTQALSGLLVRAYGDVNDPYNPMSLLFQINLNTDDLDEEGDSADLAPWQSEDALIYTSTFSMETTGGFYNSIPTDPNGLQYITKGTVLPYMLTEDLPFSTEGDPAGWTYSFSYFDDAEVVGAAVIGSHTSGADYFDHGHVYSIARISNLEDYGHAKIDAGTIFAFGLPSGAEHAAYHDAATVSSQAVISSADDYTAGVTFIRQAALVPDSDTPGTGSTATWSKPTLIGNHLFMVVSVVGHLNIFSGISITPPVGWTLYSDNLNHGVENGTGAGLFVFYKLADGSAESGAEALTFIDQSIIGELPIQWAMALIEVEAGVISNPTPVLADHASSTAAFVVGISSIGPTNAGQVFIGSGAQHPNSFVLAFSCLPSDAGGVGTHHLDNAAGNITTRADGWTLVGQASSQPSGNATPSIQVWGQPDASLSSTDLRVYDGDDVDSGAQQHPAQVWLRFA